MNSAVVSDVAKIFDVLGWFAATTISMKILLQRLWELKIEWDEPVPRISGSTGGLNSLLSPADVYLAVIFPRRPKSLPLNSMASAMPQKGHMLG